MTTTKPKSQCQRLLEYLKRHRRGITTMEAFRELGITCVHKRIAELEESHIGGPDLALIKGARITRTRVKLPSGSTVTRYSLAR